MALGPRFPGSGPAAQPSTLYFQRSVSALGHFMGSSLSGCLSSFQHIEPDPQMLGTTSLTPAP